MKPKKSPKTHYTDSWLKRLIVVDSRILFVLTLVGIIGLIGFDIYTSNRTLNNMDAFSASLSGVLLWFGVVYLVVIIIPIITATIGVFNLIVLIANFVAKIRKKVDMPKIWQILVAFVISVILITPSVIYLGIPYLIEQSRKVDQATALKMIDSCEVVYVNNFAGNLVISEELYPDQKPGFFERYISADRQVNNGNYDELNKALDDVYGRCSEEKPDLFKDDGDFSFTSDITQEVTLEQTEQLINDCKVTSVYSYGQFSNVEKDKINSIKYSEDEFDLEVGREVLDSVKKLAEDNKDSCPNINFYN